MHVLHAIDAVRLEAGGVVRAVLDLTAELARAGAQVTLVTGDATDAPPDWLDGSAGVPRVVVINPALDLFLRPKVAGPTVERLVEEADFVHLHTPWDPLNPAVAAAARAAGKPYAVSVHGMLDEWCMAGKALKKRAFLALIGRRMLEHAAFVHYTAQAERDQAMKWSPRATPFVAPLLMDLSPYTALPTGEQAEHRFAALGATTEPRLLFLSRVDPKKGVDLLIEAVASLRDDGVAVQAFVAGPGESSYVASLERLASERHVRDRIHFLGMVGGDLKWSLYNACDAFVLPTHQENFGIVLIEAMGCGLPTVTTHAVDIWKELKQHGATIVPDEADAITSAIGSLLADLPAAKQAAGVGRHGVLAWLDPATVSRQYLDAYADAIQS